MMRSPFAKSSPPRSKSCLNVPLVALAFAALLGAPLAAQDGRGDLRRARDVPPPATPRARPPGLPPVLVKVPYAGFRSEEAPEVLSHHLPVPRGFGLLVTEVWTGSPAENAGIQRHDILLRSGDQRLANPAQMNALIRSRRPGETMGLTVFRAGKEWDVNLTLWEAEEAEGREDGRPGALQQRHGQPARPPAERVRRPQGPEMDLSAGAAFSRELLEKTERIGDEALRKFREIEPFQFLQPPPLPGAPPAPETPAPKK